MTTLQKTLVTATVAVLAGAGVYEARQASNARAEIQAIKQLKAEETPQLTRERDEATNRLATLRYENDRLNRNSSELLRLRGENGGLRRQLESQKAQLDQQSAAVIVASHNVRMGLYIPKDQLARVGFETPEAAFQSFICAMASGEYDQVLAVTPPEVREEATKSGSRESFEKQCKKFGDALQGVQIVAKKVLADDKVDLGTIIFTDDKAPAVSVDHIVKVGNEWRYAGSANDEAFWAGDRQVQTAAPSLGK